MATASLHAVVDEIFDLYERFGSADYIGEPVSQLEHMSQAAEIAIKEGYDDDVILAAFFHDIGHLCGMQNQNSNMNGFGVTSHERIGANYLRAKGFPEKIARLVENHVQAKRYLTFKYPAYYSALSEASKKTLSFQGGKMSEKEAVDFENDPLFDISIQMREWDEQAKEKHLPIIDLRSLKKRAYALLSSRS